MRVLKLVFKEMFFHFKKKPQPKGYLVPVVGGLGGQILGYTLYDYLKKRGLSVRIDACELLGSSGYQLASKGQGLNRYVWDLGYYGIEPLENTDILGRPSDFPEGFTKMHEGSEERAKFYSEAVSQLDASLFPVNQKHQISLLEMYGREKLLVVHVRQSDYLNVASLVIRAEQNINLVKKLILLKPDRLIFASDGPLAVEELSKNIGFPVEIFTSPDYFLVHALLRRADLLVAANSQFSFTAGLLGSSSLAFFPKNFFGGEHGNLNFFYQKPFEYFAR